MARYNGLIIPRSYNDYYSRSDPQAIRDIVALAADGELNAESKNPLQNQAIAKIVPNTASETNKLADKNFVNSTVGTNTANYIYKTESGGEKVPFSSVAELEAYAGTVTNNDYAFVTGIDENGNTYYDRYKADVNNGVVTWAKEYRLNNSSFTAEQWAAIQSGITAEKVAQFEGAVAPVDVVQSGNMSAATSNSVYEALTNYINKTDAATLLQALQQPGVMDAAPIAGSNHPTKSGGVYNSLGAIYQGVQNISGELTAIVNYCKSNFIPARLCTARLEPTDATGIYGNSAITILYVLTSVNYGWIMALSDNRNCDIALCKIILGEPTGWIKITDENFVNGQRVQMTSDFTIANDLSFTIGKGVFINMKIQNVVLGVGGVIAQVPEGYRPNQETSVILVEDKGGIIYGWIRTNGQVVCGKAVSAPEVRIVTNYYK